MYVVDSTANKNSVGSETYKTYVPDNKLSSFLRIQPRYQGLMFVNTMDLRLVCFDRSRLTPLFLANSSLRRGVWRGCTSVRWPENQANRQFYALKPSYGCVWRYQSSPSWKRTWNSFMGVDAVNFCSGWGWILSLNWTYRCRWCGSGDSFREFIDCIT